MHLAVGSEALLILTARGEPELPNAIAETAEIDDTHKSIIAGHKRSVIDYIANLAARSHSDTPAWLPEAVGVLIDGAIVQSAVFANEAPITAARCAAAQLLEIHP